MPSRSSEPASRRRPHAGARSAADFLPARPGLRALATAAAHCRGCDLYKNATQTVFGEGPRTAQVLLVGEQPGDQEDRTGRPFVGPAGKLLGRGLKEAGIPREETYVTNAVKHFKWTARGKRRLHQRPREGEIDACQPWLLAEIEVVRPRIVVCLGSTAARAVFGRNVRVQDYRGKFTATPVAPCVYVTVHPSFLLRRPQITDREAEYARWVGDLRMVAQRLEALNPRF